MREVESEEDGLFSIVSSYVALHRLGLGGLVLLLWTLPVTSFDKTKSNSGLIKLCYYSYCLLSLEATCTRFVVVVGRSVMVVVVVGAVQ